MSCEEEVMKISKKLQKMSSAGTSDHAAAIDILTSLKSQPMTLQVLEKTRIGMTVNSFRKTTTNEDVITIAKGLIKSWKKLLDKGKGDSKEEPVKKESPPRSNSTDADEDTPDKKPEVMRQQSFPKVASDTTDVIRIKCREMITNALKCSAIPEGSQEPEELANEIEDCIYTEFSTTDMKYKNRVRSRVSNLKDARNPNLRTNVLIGLIPPERIAKMTAEEMASDEMKKIRAKLTKEAINDHQMATTGGTTTDLLKCGKCGKRKCTYNQVQTRSADEPMTTFCFCNECGHRWKFC